MTAKKSIDWSCKHEILIQNADGSYSRMDEPYYQAEEIVPGVWKILSSGDFHYVIAGEGEAIAIDTGYGAGNTREYLELLTGLPVPQVINTHNHFDHTANNGYFDRAYMGEGAIPLATTPFASFAGIDFITDYERVAVKEGDVIEVGGLSLEIFEVHDHTVDGIAILDRKHRILFTGDEFMVFGKVLSNATISQFHAYIANLEKHRADFDYVCGGSGCFKAAFLDHFYELTGSVLAGNYGEPMAPGGAPKPGMLPPGPNGELVYDRMMPHFGDGGAGHLQDETRNEYVVRGDGLMIVYDRDHI